jgi:hypothetical protein
MPTLGLIVAGVIAWMFSTNGGKGSKQSPKESPKVTTGTALLEQGKAYRIELEVGGPALQAAGRHPSDVAIAMDNGLRMAGAYDVTVTPSMPLWVTYSLVAQGTTPVVLNIAAQQKIGGIDADYTFRSVQEIKPVKPAKLAGKLYN